MRIVGPCDLNQLGGTETARAGLEDSLGDSLVHISPPLIGTQMPVARKTPVTARDDGTWPRFEAACRSHLGLDYENNKDWFLGWHDNHIAFLESPGISGFMAELEESVSGTPSGRQRRSSSVDISAFEKFSYFLERLYRKYKMQSED